jgi:deoxyribodipyrimidine photo-lyase
VEGTYDDLAAQFFAGAAPARHPPPAALRGRGDRAIVPAGPAPARPLVWITLGTASAVGPAAAAFPAAPRLFILDPAWLAAERPSLKRLVFLFECLADIPDLLVVEGPPAEVLPAAAAALACDGVAVAWTPCHRDGATARTVAAALPVAVIDEPLFCDRSRVDDLRRFSRYWQKVRDSALRPTGTPPAAG